MCSTLGEVSAMPVLLLIFLVQVSLKFSKHLEKLCVERIGLEFRYILGLIEQNKCQGSEAFLKERLDNIENNWKTLIECCTMKTRKLMEASDQQKFSSGVQDEEFWLGEVGLMMYLQSFLKSTKQLLVESLLMVALNSKRTNTTEIWNFMPCSYFIVIFGANMIHLFLSLNLNVSLQESHISHRSIPTCYF